MNRNDLNRKRAKRQVKRKDARVRASRRDAEARSARDRELAARLRPKAPAPARPGIFGRLLGTTLGGASVAPDQMDRVGADILSASDL